MKKIIFVRHGKAEDDNPDITDFERSLTLKGKIISRQMARRFRETENNPGTMITSPAFRAIETAYIFASESGIQPEDVIIDSNLYHRPGIKHLFRMFDSLDNKIDSITLFGHNPSFTEMPDRLCRSGCEFLTKSSVVCVLFQVKTWPEIKLDSGKIEYFLKPEK